MANFIGVADMRATRVPIVYPAALFAPLAVLQLVLGCDPLVLLVCLAAILVTFVPMHFFGRDIYSIFAVLFSVKYATAGLIAKTAYGQPLQSNLFRPLDSYLLCLLLMTTVTCVVMIARRFDAGKTLIPFPTDGVGLRRLGVIAFALGFVGMTIVGVAAPKEGAGSAGALVIIAVNLGGLCFLGVAAEACSAIERSKGQSLFSPLLIVMLALVLIVVVGLNMRTYFATAIITIAAIGFMARLLKPAYLVTAGLIAVFFLTFLSPLTLYLRDQRTGGTAYFLSLAVDTAVKMATDPPFYRTVVAQAKSGHLTNVFEEQAFDYFGDRSNVLNRISFIGLLDAVNEARASRAPLEFKSLALAIKTNVPTALGASKEPFPLCDWLNWQMGMETPDFSAFLNFGLPMEGLASWGVPGLVLYPLIFFTAVLLLYARIASFKAPLPVSIFLLGDLQNSMLEGNTDTYIAELVRGAPIVLGMLFGIYWLFFRRPAARSRVGGFVGRDVPSRAAG